MSALFLTAADLAVYEAWLDAQVAAAPDATVEQCETTARILDHPERVAS